MDFVRAEAVLRDTSGDLHHFIVHFNPREHSLIKVIVTNNKLLREVKVCRKVRNEMEMHLANVYMKNIKVGGP